MCEVSKMPATSLFTPSMERLAAIVPAIQTELARAEQLVQRLSERSNSGDSASRVADWLDDDAIECFFEVGLAKCPALQDVEAIASKIYISGVVLVLLYFDYTFYVYVESGDDEQPLLDTAFPDVTNQKEGVQLKTYRKGVAECPELRRLSLWKVVNDLLGDDDNDDDAPVVVDATSSAQRKRPGNSHAGLQADAKQSERRREETASKADSDEAKAAKLAELARKTSLPHHIAPLKPTAASTLKAMPDLGLKAPWDESGRPLGQRK